MYHLYNNTILLGVMIYVGATRSSVGARDTTKIRAKILKLKLKWDWWHGKKLILQKVSKIT